MNYSKQCHDLDVMVRSGEITYQEADKRFAEYTVKLMTLMFGKEPNVDINSLKRLTQTCTSFAWEQGHSNGYGEVASTFIDVVETFRPWFYNALNN